MTAALHLTATPIATLEIPWDLGVPFQYKLSNNIIPEFSLIRGPKNDRKHQNEKSEEHETPAEQDIEFISILAAA
jgi:hypothetical protein